MHNLPTQLTDGKLPLFVFPTNLTFYSDDQSSHKQLLSLYNPYEFPLKFKVLCTAPKKYTVVDSEGTIRPGCCVDIVVRHIDININNEGVKDKFRIQVVEHGQKKIIGKKEVMSILLPRKERSAQPEENFQSLPTTAMAADRSHSIMARTNKPEGGKGGPSLFVIIIALVCVVALMLPQQDDIGTRLPDYLQLSVPQKLIAAYILGLVTMVILHV